MLEEGLSNLGSSDCQLTGLQKKEYHVTAGCVRSGGPSGTRWIFWTL